MTDPEVDDWSSAERALLDAALEFYGAAEAAIDYAGPDRPRLRYDIEKMRDVRRSMAVLEGHVRQAHEDGVEADRIAAITRLEHEIVELILADDREAEPDPAGS